MPKDITPKASAKSKAQLPRSPQPQRSARMASGSSSPATTSLMLETPPELERSIQTSRSLGKSKAKSSPSQRSTVLPTATTSPFLQVPAPLFVTSDTSGHSIVNNVNVNGDQHVVYEVYATPPAPHALDLLRVLNPITMNAISRPQCLQGTREHILQSLLDNLIGPSAAAKVLWLHGMAGSGKSTIATTIAEHLHKCGQRGAFLFFDRNSPAQSGPDGVIRTLAHQLALSNGVLRSAICDAIERDPQIATTTLTSQFDNLIMTPLHSCASKITGPIVIILDAFDECGDAQSRKALLHLLVKHLPTLPHQFRFLITGRPELDLTNVFCSQPWMTSISLGAAEWSSVADVLRYIEHEFSELYQAKQRSDELPLGWPGKPTVQDIGARAGNSFIWAATAIRFLYAADDVNERLEMLLGQMAFTLGDLYATALRSASNWDPRERSTEYCRRILGAVVIGRIALTDDTIIDISGLENAKSCRLVLRRLSCLLQWSEGLPIRTLHASFADYLTDASSCGDQPWFVDGVRDHVEFTTGCLRIMKRFLRFNICQLETSHSKNHDVPDLAKRIEGCIPRSLAYACRFWAEHLSLATAKDPIMVSFILEFFNTLFVYWLEVLSLIGEARVALQAMLVVEVFGKCDVHIQAFAQDGIKFTRAFMSVISESAPHIYVSALPFAPSTSIIRQQYSRIMGNTLHVPTSTISGWPSCEQAIDGCYSSVFSVAYSPKGDRVVSGSGDGNVRVWNSRSGELVAGPFEGHLHDVRSIAFSPDGVHIASGSSDCTIRVWDARTGQLVAGPFEGHTDRINSVAFSPGGERIASGSNDNTVRVWDANGKLVGGLFKGHTASVESVAFSPNGKFIASGSSDATVIWDACTGDIVAGPFEGHDGYVLSIAFSPDGEHIASGSTDGCVRVWGVHSGALVTGPVKGHSSIITSVAFSPDGKHVASGSYDQTVRAWDAQTGQLVAGPIEGHSSYIHSVAYSPDGHYIVSGSEDHTIRIWDARIGELLAGPASDERLHVALSSQDNSVCGSQLRTSPLSAAPRNGHDDIVQSVAFSPDGKHIASGSWDGTIYVRDAHTGELVARSFDGHGSVKSIAFSPDGKRIASASLDGDVLLWDTHTGNLVAGPFEGGDSVAFSPDGECITSGLGNHTTVRVWDSRTGRLVAGPFEGHTSQVSSVAFSPNGRCIASGSWDRTIRIWDPRTGNLVAGPLEGHSGIVASVVFSPDSLHLASGSHDATIRVWDANTGRLVAGPLQGHTECVSSVAFSLDGLHIVSGSEDHTVRVWAFRRSEFHLTPINSARCEVLVNSVAFSPDGARIAAGSNDHTVCVIDAHTGEIAAGPFLGHVSEVTSVAFSPNGEHIASGSMDNTIRIWDARTGGLLTRPLEGHTGAVCCVAFSPNGRIIVSGSWNGTICMWDVWTGQLLAEPLKGHAAPVRSIAFSPDGVHIASGSYDRTIRVWDARTGQLVAGPLAGHTRRVNSFAFSPGGEHIASGSNDNTVRIWDLRTGRLVTSPFEEHDDRVTSVAFSPNGQLIASGSWDGTIYIWNPCTGEIVKGPLDAGTIQSVTFSPNGLGVASGGAAIRIWDVQPSSFIAVPFEGHTGPVNSVAFSPNGEHIMSGSEDKTIHIFDMPTNANTSSRQGFKSSSELVNGWMQNSPTELLFWVPPAYRTGLWRANSTVVIGQQTTRLDLTRFAHGRDWAQCHI